MRILPLTGDLKTDLHVMLSNQLFPKEPDFANVDLFLSLRGADLQQLDPEAKVELTAHDVRCLLLSPRLSEFEKLRAVREREGATAGLLLAIIYLMAQANTGKTRRTKNAPSKNIAIAIIEKHARELRARPISIFTTRKRILSAWESMEPIAHLWAATELMAEGGYFVDKPPEPSKITDLLRLASAIRRFACSNRPSRTNSTAPLMTEATCIHLPEEFERNPMDIPAGDVRDSLVSLVNSYAAPKSF